MVLRIPPLNPLRFFEVAARTGNLTLAAQELHVTQSAVSRQIGVLESYLGVELFRRDRHGVSLTRAGMAFASEVTPAFGKIAAATDRLIRDSSHGALRIRTYTTFTSRWLIPRLPEFRQLHPNIELRIGNAIPDVDFDRDNVDLAIQFGDGKWPRVSVDLLFPDEIEPVCSPQYLAQLGSGVPPEQLLQKRLLVARHRHSDWDDWLTATGSVSNAEDAERMTFSSSELSWQAAINGLGIAIGQTYMLKREFETGSLLRPFMKPLKRDKAHYLVRPELQRYSRKVVIFREWLLKNMLDTASK